MRLFLQRLGISRDRIAFEAQSRSTFENVSHATELIRRGAYKRVAVVTHPSHLLRAGLCFRKQGLTVIRCGCPGRFGA